MTGERKFESIDEAEAHFVQRLDARASHVIAAARQSVDAETLRQIEAYEAKGAVLVVIAAGDGRVAIALTDGKTIGPAIYEVFADGHSVVRALRGIQ